ncbi:glycosyltransferase family 1 protein [Muriicola sp. SD30]|uniref:glycosyltransferase family 1 protein n=1 Tax=Muriicola sp. SD30 TaxID=3240936 RepID=UPI00350F24B7
MNHLDKPVKNVAIIYPYFAHYRLPVLRELSKSTTIRYTLISDPNSGNDIKKIDPGIANKNLEDGGLRWKFVKNNWLYKEAILWQSGLLRHLRKEKFDDVIFLANAYYLSTWFATLYLKITGKKVYMWTHGVITTKKDWKWRLRKVFYGLSDGVLLYGHKAKEVMASNGFPEKKLHVIYNSTGSIDDLIKKNEISNEIRNHTKKQLFKYPNLPILIFVGRLTYVKKLNQILEAVHILAQEDFKVNVLFVGDGEARKDLESLAQNLNLTNYCHFYGACFKNEELELLFTISSLCVSPGEVGLTAMSALGNGTPVLSHDDFNYQMPEYEAIEPGINGMLFKRNSISDLALKTKQWIIENKDTPEEIMRSNCNKIIREKYNAEYQAKLINTILLNNE